MAINKDILREKYENLSKQNKTANKDDVKIQGQEQQENTRNILKTLN